MCRFIERTTLSSLSCLRGYFIPKTQSITVTASFIVLSKEDHPCIIRWISNAHSPTEWQQFVVLRICIITHLVQRQKKKAASNLLFLFFLRRFFIFHSSSKIFFNFVGKKKKKTQHNIGSAGIQRTHFGFSHFSIMLRAIFGKSESMA